MLQEILMSRDTFFNTYYIYDEENRKYIGILEHHNRQVKTNYFIGWHFENEEFIPRSNQAGKTKMFYNKAEAINYICGKE